MRSVPRSFWHEFRGAFARLPVWLPGTRLRLGDIGLLDPSGWSPVSTLADQGITHRTGPQGAPVDYDYRSMDGTEVVARAAGQAGPGTAALAGGSVQYRFSRQGAFVLQAPTVRARQIADLAAVAEQVLAAYQAGRWSREWMVVTELALAGSVFILVAGQAGAEATVEIGAGLADTGFRLTSERGLAASFVSPEPTILMWAGRYVRDPRLGRTSFEVRGPGVTEGAEEPSFAEVTAAPTAFPPDPGQPPGR